MDFLGKDMRKVRKDDKEVKEEDKEKEIKSNILIFRLVLYFNRWLFFSVLDEGDIALLKSYVSLIRFYK